MKTGVLLLAGSLFFSGNIGRVKAGVTVDGLDVGGLSYVEAVERIRAYHVRVPLTVITPNGTFDAPVFYTDNAEDIVKSARRGGTYSVTWRREWVTLEDDLLALCEQNAREGEDARLLFSSQGFCYIPARDALVCRYDALVDDAVRALRDGERELHLIPVSRAPEITEQTLKARTRLLAEFSTSFRTDNAPRAHNIALAARLISGAVIGAGETFSFNTRVGARTKQRGFEEAPVISGGEFVQGVGGGVCQASTTLFGAALRAGLEIAESHPHSLSVGYVSPSQDAMVSSASDLKLKNPYPYPVYLMGNAQDGRVTFRIFGMPDGKKYRVESRVLFTLDPPPEQVVEGEEDKVMRAEKQGMASESYRMVYENGVLIERKLVRRDTYACVQGIREVKKPTPAPPPPLEGD